MKIGAIDVHTVKDGLFKLDGGAMFGIVPKPVWERVAPPDAKNRIELSLNPLLIRAAGKNILVDTGIGNKWDAKWMDMYAIDHRWSVPESLKQLGLSVADVDYVVPSHMHFDHMGGATVREGGRVVPTFPKATYIIQEKEWEAAFSDNPRTKGSYVKDDIVPIERKKKLINGSEEIVPGVWVKHTNAHTQGHQVVVIESQGKRGIYLGDLMPTACHLKPAWCMGYDLFPMEVAKFKQEFLQQAARDGTVLIFDHEVKFTMATVQFEGNDYKLTPIQG